MKSFCTINIQENYTRKVSGGSESSFVHLVCSQDSKSRHKYCLMGRKKSKVKDRKQEYGRQILRWLHDLYLLMLMLFYNHHPKIKFVQDYNLCLTNSKVKVMGCHFYN